MTEVPPEANEADIQEQEEEVVLDADDDDLPEGPLRDHVSEHDAIEQERAVGVDEDDYR